MKAETQFCTVFQAVADNTQHNSFSSFALTWIPHSSWSIFPILSSNAKLCFELQLDSLQEFKCTFALKVPWMLPVPHKPTLTAESVRRAPGRTGAASSQHHCFPYTAFKLALSSYSDKWQRFFLQGEIAANWKLVWVLSGSSQGEFEAPSGGTSKQLCKLCCFVLQPLGWGCFSPWVLYSHCPHHAAFTKHEKSARLNTKY